MNSKYKVLATNCWAEAVYRYFFAGMRVARTPQIRLDEATRVEMRWVGGHYRQASLPRM